jgi:hypothetical protein
MDVHTSNNYMHLNLHFKFKLNKNLAGINCQPDLKNKTYFTNVAGSTPAALRIAANAL